MKKYLLLPVLPFLLAASCEKEPVEVVTPDLPVVSTPLKWEDAKLVWSDEFDGTTLNTDNWAFDTGASGWGNNELQNYTDGENVSVSDGTLKIITRKSGDGQKVGDYTSTRMTSKKSWVYGRIEIRAKMPEDKGPGLWPAIWMLGDNITTAGWPKCGEIDIMEYVSYEPNRVHQTIHSEANNHTKGTQITSGPKMLETIEEEFHTYGILWDFKGMKFYVDDIDNVQLNFPIPTPQNENNWPFDKKFFILLNMAVGGNWGGLQGVDDSIFPATFEIDYVRVYQHG